MLNKLVYLELNDNFLLLSKLKEKKDKFFLSNPEKIELKNLEFKNGIFYNPSALFLHIHNFLNANKIKNPTTIACILSTFNQNQIKQNLNILQASLCFCKSGLKIGKIINMSLIKKEEQMPFSDYFYKNELEKQLDFFKPFTQEHNKFSKKFLISFVLFFLFLCPTLFVVQKNKNLELKKIQNQKLKLLATNKLLEEKVEAAHTLKKNNTIMSQKIEKIQRYQNYTHNLQKFLFDITKQIPKDCNLSKIRFEASKKEEANDVKSHPKTTLFKIEGSTSNQQEVTHLLQKLSKTPDLEKLKISKIQKIKNKVAKKSTKPTANPAFSFQITGEIKKVCLR